MTKVQLKYLGFAVLLSILWACALYGVLAFAAFSLDTSTWHPIVRLMLGGMWLGGCIPICFETYEAYTNHEDNK